MPAALAAELNFPTGIAIAGDGSIYITESGLTAGGRPATGRVLHISDSGAQTVIADGLRAPVTGLTRDNGALYVSEGGHPGRISRIDLATGQRSTVLDDLPSRGDYHTNTPLISDGWLYFGQGAATNSGILSWDPLTMPWVNGSDLAHDLPGYDIRLAHPAAFQPHGQSVAKGTRIKAQLPCTSGVMRCRLDGTQLQTVVWGFRNPFALTQTATRDILVIDLGMNDRGARPFGSVPSCVYRLQTGQWYGWPDFAASTPVTDPAYASRRTGPPETGFLLQDHEILGPPAQPLFRFPEHSGPTDIITDPRNPDQLLIALFGDKRPLTGAPGPKAGRAVVHLNLASGVMTPLAMPALHRPIALATSPDADQLYVLDFGAYEIDRTGRMIPQTAKGTLWQMASNGLCEQTQTAMQAAE